VRLIVTPGSQESIASGSRGYVQIIADAGADHTNATAALAGGGHLGVLGRAKFASPRARATSRAAWAILGAHLHGLAATVAASRCRRHRHPGEYTREALT